MVTSWSRRCLLKILIVVKIDSSSKLLLFLNFCLYYPVSLFGKNSKIVSPVLQSNLNDRNFSVSPSLILDEGRFPSSNQAKDFSDSKNFETSKQTAFRSSDSSEIKPYGYCLFPVSRFSLNLFQLSCFLKDSSLMSCLFLSSLMLLHLLRKIGLYSLCLRVRHDSAHLQDPNWSKFNHGHYQWKSVLTKLTAVSSFFLFLFTLIYILRQIRLFMC